MLELFFIEFFLVESVCVKMMVNRLLDGFLDLCGIDRRPHRYGSAESWGWPFLLFGPQNPLSDMVL